MDVDSSEFRKVHNQIFIWPIIKLVPVIARVAEKIDNIQRSKQMYSGGYVTGTGNNSDDNSQLLNYLLVTLNKINHRLNNPVPGSINWKQNDTLNLRDEISEVNLIDEEGIIN